jgi:hypothetical protein
MLFSLFCAAQQQQEEATHSFFFLTVVCPTPNHYFPFSFSLKKSHLSLSPSFLFRKINKKSIANKGF